MKRALVSLAALSAPLQLHAVATPIGKVLGMISDLEASIIKEGQVVQKQYAEFAEWCEDRSSNLGNEIKTGKADVDSLKASIAKEEATLVSLQLQVGQNAADIATDQHDLQAATEIRTKEAANFAAEERELVETIDMLVRAIGILEREMNGGASMMQLKKAGNLAQALTVMVQASLIRTSDASRLTAFLQDSQKAQDSDADEAPGAPDAAAYESHSGNILDTLDDLREKAESQLADARKEETTDKHNFEMLQQSLVDEIKFATKDMNEAKKGTAASSERKATAEGGLQVASAELAEDSKAKGTLHHDCMTRAEAFEAETKSRGEELKALATAKKLIKEATTGASFAFDQVAFVQLARSSISSRADLANYEVVHIVRDLARKHSSSALAQLASRMTAAMQSGVADPFGKVKGLISDMIAKLEQEAGADATKKAWCDTELSETNEKKADKTDEIAKLTTKIDQMSAKSSQLKEEVAALDSELFKLSKSQAEMNKLRQEEKAAFEESKAELEKGLEGVKVALNVLREYYAQDDQAHSASEGSASGIMGLLEVIEADLSKNLAEATSEEEAAVNEYEEVSKENEIEKTTKEQDVKYKTKDSKYLDKTSAELNSDRSNTQQELDAVMEYLSKIEADCIAKAETYGARKARHEAEIAGLKEALQILESETALVQKRTARRTLRGRSLVVAP